MQNLKLINIFDFRFILLILFFLYCCYLFDFTSTFNLTNSGGGFYVSKFLFNNNFLFYLINFAFHSLVSQFLLIKKIVYYFLVNLSHPQITIWQGLQSNIVLFNFAIIFFRFC